VRTTVAAPCLCHALDFVDGVRSKVADVQELHDGPGGSTDVRLCRWSTRRGAGGERAAVDQTARVQSQHAPQPIQRGGFGHSFTSGADMGMRQAAPRTAVAGRMRDAGADVPAVGCGHLHRGHLPRVQANGPRKAALVPLDRVASLSAAISLSTAQEPAGAVVLDAQ
jgi:hypothetical protein